MIIKENSSLIMYTSLYNSQPSLTKRLLSPAKFPSNFIFIGTCQCSTSGVQLFNCDQKRLKIIIIMKSPEADFQHQSIQLLNKKKLPPLPTVKNHKA